MALPSRHFLHKETNRENASKPKQFRVDFTFCAAEIGLSGRGGWIHRKSADGRRPLHQN